MKYPRASGALRRAPDPTLKRARFARRMLLRTVGNLGLSRSGPPRIKSWIRPCCCEQNGYSSFVDRIPNFFHRVKIGGNQSESQLISQLQHGFALEFERSDPARKLRLLLSEILFVLAQVRFRQ